MPRPHKNTSPAIIHKPTAVSVTNTRPSLGQTMKEGFGLGIGMSVGQHAVNGVMSFLSTPKSSSIVENKEVEGKQIEYAQNKDFESARLPSVIEYEKCMKYSSNDTEFCRTLLDN
jgi:hypothetical protein